MQGTFTSSETVTLTLNPLHLYRQRLRGTLKSSQKLQVYSIEERRRRDGSKHGSK